MPRRTKPLGYERWTWAEINAGRRMNKAEKRWNRVAKNLDWDQRPDGTYQAPPQAVPYLVVITGLMLVLGFLAPNGMQAGKGADAAAATIVLLMIMVAIILLVVF